MRIRLVCDVCGREGRGLIGHETSPWGVCTICFKRLDKWAHAHNWGTDIWPLVEAVISTLKSRPGAGSYQGLRLRPGEGLVQEAIRMSGERRRL